LSAERSWVIADEANRFAWPGHDIGPIKGTEPSIRYGFGPSRLFSQFRDHGVAVGTGRVIIDCDELLGRVVGGRGMGQARVAGRSDCLSVALAPPRLPASGGGGR